MNHSHGRLRAIARVATALAAVVIGVLPVRADAQSSEPTSTPATQEQAPTPISVATKPLDPFVMRADDGTYSGFSVDIWNEIARRNNWQTEWQWNEKVTEVLASVQDKRAEVGIAGITINQEREQTVDFSHPMFNGGLQIAVSGKQKSGWRSAVDQMLSPQLLRLLATLAIGIFVAGNVVWLTRFRHRADTKRYRDGLPAGIWFAGKTLGSADFGDEEPRKPGGRLIALGWMFFGIIVIQYFTALTTTQLTVQKIEGNIQGVQDLPGKRIATVEGSTADKWLNEQGLAHQRTTTIEETYPLLLSGEVEAIVYDAPVLLRWTATAANGKARTVGSIFKPEAYGIALQPGSALREAVNNSLLEMQGDGTFTDLYAKWFAN
jgi:polar amino acid transport system substrate-binding protein